MYTQEDLVNVAVPRSRLAEVYALLGSEPAAPPTEAIGAQAAPDEWTQDLVNRAYRESAERMRFVFDHLAGHPGEWSSASDLAKAMGVAQPQLRGVLGGFGHRIRSRYHIDHWPFTGRWNEEESTAYYRMSKEQAEAVKVARSLA
jgi:hypothetical protein